MKLYIKHNNELKPLGGDSNLTKDDIIKILGYTPSDGNYTNLSNKPVIPTKVSDLIDGAYYAKIDKVVPTSRTIANIDLQDNITKEELYNAIIDLFGSASKYNVGNTTNTIPLIGSNGMLARNIIPLPDALIFGGIIIRIDDNTAKITPSNEFIVRFPDVRYDEDLIVNVSNVYYENTYFLATTATAEGAETILEIENCHMGDWIVCLGKNGWVKNDNNDSVKSVNGMRGVILLNGTHIKLNNYIQSSADDNNLSNADTVQSALGKLETRTKKLEQTTSASLPNLVLEIVDLNNPTISELTVINEQIKSATNDFGTTLDLSKFNEVILKSNVGTQSEPDERYYSLIGFEHKDYDPPFYKLIFNIEKNVEYTLTLTYDIMPSFEKIEYVSKESFDQQIGDINAILDAINGEVI